VNAQAVQQDIQRRLPTGACITRVHVVEETSSTQDLAAGLVRSDGPGVMVVGLRQTSGRGRLGRTWHDGAGLGVAATFAVRRSQFACGDAAIPLAAGLAACCTCEAARASASFGLRWPNDVVERSAGRKIAGVLIENCGPAALVGVGLNVAHCAADWPDSLRATACSLRMLGSACDVPAAAGELAAQFCRIAGCTAQEVLEAWRPRDVLLGTLRTFVHDGRTYRGVVRGLDPLSEIAVETPAGEFVRLPALTTSMVHEAPVGTGPSA